MEVDVKYCDEDMTIPLIAVLVGVEGELGTTGRLHEGPDLVRVNKAWEGVVEVVVSRVEAPCMEDATVAPHMKAPNVNAGSVVDGTEVMG